VGESSLCLRQENIEEDINKWKDTTHAWVARFSTAKMFTIPKVMYLFTVIPIKIPMLFFTDIEKIHLKFTGNHRRPRLAIAV
jgi:hypothetical protein